MAVWASWILLATLIVWTAGSGSGGPHGDLVDPSSPVKYIIYSLPLTLGLAYYVIFDGEQLRLDLFGAAALVMYSLLAVITMALNSWLNFYALRDLFIVSSYLFLFVFWFRAPASVTDMALAALAFCMVIEAVTRMGPDVRLVGTEDLYGLLGVSNPTGNNLFGSHGILELTLGFPQALSCSTTFTKGDGASR